MSANYSLLLVFFFYALSALTALFWGAFLFMRRKQSRQNLYFSVIFFVVGLLYLRNSFVRLPVMEACDIYNPLSYFILIFIAPFTIFYLYFAIDERPGLRHKLMHFIPFAFWGVFWIFLKVFHIPELPFCHSFGDILGHARQYPICTGFFLLLQLTFIVQVITYFSMALVKLIRIGRQYKARGISLRPVTILTVMDVLFLLYPLVCVVFMSRKNSLGFGGAGFHLFVALVLTAIAVLNLQLKLPLKTFPRAASSPKEKNAIADRGYEAKKDDDSDRILAAKVAVAFEMKEMFRLPHLRLQDLAAELGTNRTYLSDCINRHFGCNFNQLVISYRINAAKKLLVNTDMSIQKIIDEVGFNTRSSFYKAFKEKVSESMSPVDWRSKIRVHISLKEDGEGCLS